MATEDNETRPNVPLVLQVVEMKTVWRDLFETRLMNNCVQEGTISSWTLDE